MKTEVPNRNGIGPVRDIASREALNRFRKASRAFIKRATKSRAAALDTLVSEGVYTKSGRV